MSITKHVFVYQFPPYSQPCKVFCRPWFIRWVNWGTGRLSKVLRCPIGHWSQSSLSFPGCTSRDDGRDLPEVTRQAPLCLKPSLPGHNLCYKEPQTLLFPIIIPHPNNRNSLQCSHSSAPAEAQACSLAKAIFTSNPAMALSKRLNPDNVPGTQVPIFLSPAFTMIFNSCLWWSTKNSSSPELETLPCFPQLPKDYTSCLFF